jgi:hypothetical protein
MVTTVKKNGKCHFRAASGKIANAGFGVASVAQREGRD